MKKLFYSLIFCLFSTTVVSQPMLCDEEVNHIFENAKHTNQYAIAIPLLQQYANQCLKEKNEDAFLYTYTLIFACLQRQNKSADFIAFEPFLRKYLEKDTEDALIVCQNMGGAYASIFRYEEAFYYLDKALDKSRKIRIEDANILVELQQEVATINFIIGNYPKAIMYYQKAIKDKERIPTMDEEYEIGIGKLYHSIGRAYLEAHNFKMAIPYLNKAHSICNKTSDKILFITNDIILADALCRLKDYGKARQIGMNALSAAYKSKLDGRITRIYLLIADIDRAEGKMVDAIQWAKRGIALRKQAKDPNLVYSYEQLGAIYTEMKDYPTALRYLDTGLVVCGYKKSVLAIKYREMAAIELLKTKIAALVADRQYDKARTATYQADTLIDKMRRDYQKDNATKLFWREKVAPLYKDAVEISFLRQKKEDAFYFIEKSRAILLLDKQKANGAMQFLTLNEQAELIRLKNKKEALANSMDMVAIQSSEEAYEQYIKKLATGNPAFRRFREQNTSISIQNIQAFLPKNATFLTYFTLDHTDSLFAMAISPARVTFEKLYYPRDTILQYQTILAQNKRNDKEAAISYFIYQNIVAPLEIPPTIQHLILSTDGELMNIPFEALAMNERGTDRLLQHYACQYSYSAATLWHSQTKAKSVRYATETVCIAPIHFQQYNKVDLVQSEALMRALSIRANTILQEKQATKANFMHHAPKARILQLITHGEAYTERGEPCIFLSDSILWLSELEKQPIDAQLAVLTACESNAGKAAKGEGVLSWAYSFAKAGVPATVASLWSADEAAAMEITQLFHQYLAKGWTKSRALQQAKLDFLEGDMNNCPPNLWANFIMYGEDAPVGNSSFPPHYYWLAFGGLLSVLLGIKMVRLKSRGKVYN